MEKKTKEAPDPLPYIITFAILFVITMAVLTWALYEWYQSQQCGLEPNFWCSDDWVCGTGCTAGATGDAPDTSACFYSLQIGSTGYQGIGSCLYGPESSIALSCGNHGQPAGSGVPLCACVIQAGANNCLSGCPTSLAGQNASRCNCVPTAKNGCGTT